MSDKTLEDHARAIGAAIKAAAEDGFYLDLGDGCAVIALELNDVDERGEPTAWEEIQLPDSPLP
ncbi:hypothetical protein ACF1DV_25875 [Streptomyces achromogenes]|uniref:hypothetical protein n=1 Tax=Streptomyces achromogenes TaxID=67255 RepID=UPI0036F886E7